MFKKSNRNFRQKKAESDDEPEEEEKNALEQAKAVNLARNEEKLKAKVLSFKDEISLGDLDEDGSNDAGDGDEDVGEFKVKKSRESRRIIKEMKKMRREKERQQQQPERTDYNVPEPIVYNKNVSSASGARGGGVTIDSKKEKGKYLVNKYGSGEVDDEGENGNGHNQDDEVKSDDNHDEEEDHDEKLRVRII